MKQKLQQKWVQIVLAVAGIFVSGSTQASHTMGADLTYQCLGGNSYKVTLSFYRDCIGIPAPANAVVSINSPSCGQNLSVTCYPRPGTGQEVTPTCSSSVTTCNGGSFTGIQEWIYDGIVTLPMQCTDWIFGYSLCCRNAAITTINTPSSNTFYIYATLNNVISPCNSSPTFSNKPVPFLCLGQQFCFNHGAYDADGDSLVYSLITPKQTVSTNVVYHAPYNASNPLNSSPATSFNSSNGDICLTPQALEVTVMAVLVEEYRNGVKIGSVERDLQLTVMNCANNLPSLTGINGTNNFSLTVCANQQTCFDIFSNDPDAGQQLTVDWNYGIPAGTFTTSVAGHPVGTFCWTPPQSAVGHSYTFTATVTDDACPYNGSQTYAYTINVVGINVSAGPDQAIACSDYATLTAVGSGGSGSYTYLWSNGSTMQSITVGEGTYWVTASDGSCTSTDTVVVTMPFLPTANFLHTSAGCNNLPVQFTDSSTTLGGALSAWYWTFGDGGTSTLQNPLHQYPGVGSYTVSLVVENNLGCRDTITKVLVIEPPVVAQFSASATCVSTSVSFTDQTTGSPISWNWLFGDGSTSNLQNPFHTYTSPGSYQVTLITGNISGCIDTVVQPLIIFPLPAANAGADLSVCTGNSVTLTATGGTTYNWTPIGMTGSSVTFTPSSSTTVVVQVTDANGCVSTDTVFVSLNPLPVISAGNDQTVCSGTAVTLTAVGGVTYTWNPGGSTSPSVNVSPSTTTTYIVTGSDANGCTSTDAVVVNVNALPPANAGPDINICEGNSATLSASGGGTYIWSPGGATSSTLSVNPSTSQTYHVTVSAGGCTTTDSVRVNVNSRPVVNLPSSFLCVGATTVLDAGNSGSTYLWSTGQTTQTIIISSGGNYSVTVTNTNGCSASDTSTVTYDSTIVLNLADVSFCQGDSAVLDAGYTGMNFLWSPGGQTTQSITVFNAGTYEVTVSDNSGCSGSMSIAAIVNPLPVSNFSGGPVCFGNPMNFTDGSTITNGSIQSWSWDFGDGNTSQIQDPVNTYTAPGNYSVSLTVTSDQGCSSTVSNTISVNSLPVADFTFANTCQDDAVAFSDASTVSSGNIVSYNWNFGDGNTSGTQHPVHTYASPGNYIVNLEVTTAGGCTNTVSHSVVINPKPQADFLAPATCLGNQTVFSNLSTISTGSLNSIAWDFNDTYTSTQNSPSHTFATAGTYAVKLIVISSYGCKDTVVKNVIIHALPVVNAGANQSLCAGESATLIASGNGSHFWMPGSMNNDTVIVSPSSTTMYTVTLTDANGCTVTDDVTVNVNSLPNANAGADRNLCMGGSVTLNGSGGLSYNWTPGNIATSTVLVQPVADTDYLLTVTDANGCMDTDTVQVHVLNNPIVSAGPDQHICSGSTVAFNASGASSYLWIPVGYSTANILVTPAATSDYIVMGTSAEGCSSYDTVKVFVDPIPLVVLTNAFLCDGYTVTLDAGNPGYIHNWSTGETTQTITVSDSGLYSVIVTGPNGCPAYAASVVEKFGNPNSPPVIYNACDNELVTMNAGNPGMFYQWSTGQSSQSINVATAGNYTVTVTDSHGCSGTMNHIVHYHPYPVASMQVSPVCLGNSSLFSNLSSVTAGSITGVHWDFGDAFTSVSQNPQHTYASSGSYNVLLTVTTDRGCSDTAQSTILVNPLPVADFTAAPVCRNEMMVFADNSGLSSGTISSWQWNFGDGQTSSSSSPMHQFAATGSYVSTLIVTSDVGCSDTISKNVTILGQPDASFTAGNECLGINLQFTNNSISSGSPLVSYQWNLGDGNTSTVYEPSVNYAQAGSYSVTLIASAANGCTDTASQVITIFPNPASVFQTGPACLGTAVSVQNNSSVSTGSIQNYYWNFGDNAVYSSVNPMHTYANEGTYTITLVTTSDHGCKDSSSVPVTIHPLPQPSFSAQDLCLGNTVNFNNTSSINSGSIAQWNWSFNDGNSSVLQSPTHLYTLPGTYHVTLKAVSDMGCVDSVSGSLNIFPNPAADFATSNVCFGNGTQFLNLTSIQGGGTYTSNWSLGDGDSTTFINPLHQYLNPGNYTVHLAVTSSQGCTDQTTKNISVYNNPLARFSAPDNCTGQTTQFTNTSTSQDGQITGTFWSFGDGTHSIDMNPSHSYSGVGNYNVELQVITSYGCADSFNDTITMHAIPQVNIQSGNGCEGSQINFTGTSDQQAGTGFVWNMSNGFTSTSQSFDYTFTTAGQYNVTLTATNSEGCSGNLSQQVTIYANPTASFSSGDVCESSPVVFNNLSSTPAGSTNNYTWSFGDNQQTTSSNPTHTYGTWGNYQVTLTSTTEHGCTANIAKLVQVHPKPQVSILAGMQGCSPVNAFFSETSSIPQGSIVSWLWSFGDGEVSTDRYTSHVFTQSGTYEATLTVASDFGCINSTTMANAVVVYPEPVADFVTDRTIIDLQMPVVSFYNQSQNYTSYQWNFGDGTSTSTELNPTHAFRDTGTYSAMLIARTSQGCVDTIQKFIEVRIHSTLFIANTFTPNGDGNNDDFRPYWTNMKEIKVWIFDRWGKMLSSWNDINGSWDGYYEGRKCQKDTYVYKIQGTGLDGKYSEWVGHVNLIY